jgi:DNA-directed RNA polymerase subunit RPC12/RpoP
MAKEHAQKVKTYKFTCPDCKQHKVVSVETCVRGFPITVIGEGGYLDYDYNNINDDDHGDSKLEYYECSNCGKIITDDDGTEITDMEDFTNWAKTHCPQD